MGQYRRKYQRTLLAGLVRMYNLNPNAQAQTGLPKQMQLKRRVEFEVYLNPGGIAFGDNWEGTRLRQAQHFPRRLRSHEPSTPKDKHSVSGGVVGRSIISFPSAERNCLPKNPSICLILLQPSIVFSWSAIASVNFT